MDCIFCKIANHQIQAKIIYEDDNVVSFLDNEPINEGHILVIPKKHFVDADDMPLELLFQITKISQAILKAIKKTYNPNGYSIMQNGGIFNDIGHYHMHIFPRYESDGFGWTSSNDAHENSESVLKKILKNI